MYHPQNYRMNEYEAEHGEEHLIYEWTADLAEKWPTKAHCDRMGWDHKLTVAAYHWRLLGGPPVAKVVSASWKRRVAHIRPSAQFDSPIAIINVNLVRKWSQYLGWITNGRLREIKPIDVSRTGYPNYRRVVHPDHLSDGFPLAIE